MTLQERQDYQRAERAMLAQRAPGVYRDMRGESRCVICGCSDSFACPDGCCWVTLELCSACADDRAAVVVLAERLAEAHKTLLGVAAYAARVLKETDGVWPPAVRATQCRRGLEHIGAECRRVHAAGTANDEVTG